MSFLRHNALRLAWIGATLATLGSLYFQYVLDLPPCVLCWFQRIFMYPLVLILALGMKWKNEHLKAYTLPLTIIGGGIALYHNLLYYKILPEAIAPCEAGVSCTSKLIEWGGFITIPLLALAGFITITVLLLIHKEEPSATPTPTSSAS